MSKYPKMQGTAPRPRPDIQRPRPAFPANDPAPWPKSPFPTIKGVPPQVYLPKLGKKILPRLVPGIGGALLAKDIYDWLTDPRPGNVPNPYRYRRSIFCQTPEGVDRWKQTDIVNCPNHSLSGYSVNFPSGTPLTISTGKFQFIGSGGFERVKQFETWVLRNPAVFTNLPVQVPRRVFRPRPGTNPKPIPEFVPRIPPEELPIMKPAPKPRPKPWPEATPQPGEQPGGAPAQWPGSSPSSRPNPRARPIRLPRFPAPIVVAPPFVVPGPGQSPVPVTPPQVVISPPASGPGSSPSPGSSPIRVTPHNPSNRPPPKGTKEKKLNIRSVAGSAWVVINIATETNDFIGAMWEGVPKNLRSKKNGIWQVTPHQKLKDIYNNFDKWDAAKAMTAYLNNQFEDWVYGQLGMATGKASRNLNVTTGMGGAVRRAGNNAPDNETKPLPELVYNEKTGEARIEYPALGVSFQLKPRG